MDFPFHEVYKLADYYSRHKPCIFFGYYRYEDELQVNYHLDRKKSYVSDTTIFWTGQDALKCVDIPFLARHVTAHPKVHKLLIDKDRECKLIKPAAFLLEQQPQKLGKKIYAYCPNNAPDYHGKKIIDELISAGYDIVIGHGNFSQKEWRLMADFLYCDIFIGLCLSEFAGGGLSIIEMGLRGIKVVTNVLNLPNCVPWDSLEDVMQAIEMESKNIGQVKESVARYTWDALDHKHEWLNI